MILTIHVPRSTLHAALDPLSQPNSSSWEAMQTSSHLLLTIILEYLTFLIYKTAPGIYRLHPAT